jgi:hypothetical protein
MCGAHERLSRIDQHIKDEPCAKQRALLGVFSSRSSSVSRGVRSAFPIFIGSPLVSVPFYGWDNFMDGTLSRQLVLNLVCTGIFFVRSVFLAFLSSAARGASHQHSKNGAEVLRCVQTYRHGPTFETPRRPPVEIELVYIRNGHALPRYVLVAIKISPTPPKWVQTTRLAIGYNMCSKSPVCEQDD